MTFIMASYVSLPTKYSLNVSGELKPLRGDEIYPKINRKNYSTIYPVGVQVLFRVFNILTCDRIIRFKGLMILAFIPANRTEKILEAHK